jgi:hypothetical protein
MAQHLAQKTEALSCLVCIARGATKRPNPNRISRVTIQSRSVMLCREHAGLVAINMPKTWDELRALFGGSADRRSPIPRRTEYDDRRVFPPRPEGRRKSYGRRRLDLDS